MNLNDEQRAEVFEGEKICGNCKWFEEIKYPVAKCNHPDIPDFFKQRNEECSCYFIPSRFSPSHGSSLGETKTKDLEEENE